MYMTTETTHHACTTLRHVKTNVGLLHGLVVREAHRHIAVPELQERDASTVAWHDTHTVPVETTVNESRGYDWPAKSDSQYSLLTPLLKRLSRGRGKSSCT